MNAEDLEPGHTYFLTSGEIVDFVKVGFNGWIIVQSDNRNFGVRPEEIIDCLI